MPTAPVAARLDFALLQRRVEAASLRPRTTLWLLLGLLTMVTATVVTLVLYLRTFETEDANRRRAAEVQWLEQTARFHFRRLEEDLNAMAHRLALGGSDAEPSREGGQLWRNPGVLLHQGWLPVDGAGDAAILARLRADRAADPLAAASIDAMFDITRGLRRPSYAGPMNLPAASGVRLWVAVPLFERGRFLGHALAELDLRRAVETLVPTWYLQGQRLELLGGTGGGEVGVDGQPDTLVAQLDLPGTDMAMTVRAPPTSAPGVPRTFLAVALLCLLGMLGSLFLLRRDFVKRQRIEASLQAQVAVRSAMEHAVNVGLRVWDMDGRLLYVNPAFARMVGFEAPELIGHRGPMPYWLEGGSDERQMARQHQGGEQAEDRGFEVQLRHRSGRLLDVLIHEAALMDPSGVQIGWMSAVTDISERRQAERLAARQQAAFEASGRLVAVGEVASTLAHELNQPLGALTSFASGLVNRLQGGRIDLVEVLPVAERLQALAEKAGRVIQRVNAFARQRDTSPQALELTDFVRRTLEPIQRETTVPIRCELPVQGLWVQADALLLEHALRNVVGNAVQWAGTRPEAAQVRLELFRDGERVGLAVADSGPGVPDEHREHVFDPFFSFKEGGMGMGLAICRSVVEAHHGQVEIGRDERLGGARFTLWLPLAQAPEGTDPGATPTHVEAAL